MALADLLDKLERGAGTAGTASPAPDVPPEHVKPQGGTAGTAGTAENDNGRQMSGNAWLLHFAGHERLEVWHFPAVTHAQALAGYPDALAAEPFNENVPDDEETLPDARDCINCRHRKQPGLAEPGHCAIRTDQPPAYTPGHPLHLLPVDGGANCTYFES